MIFSKINIGNHSVVLFHRCKDTVVGDGGSFCKKIDDIISDHNKYYITQSIAILGLSYCNIKTFSIDDSKLNDTAKLNKRQSPNPIHY